VSNIIHTATGGNVTFTYGHDNSGLVTNLTVSDDLFAPFTNIAGTKSFSPNSLNQYTSAMGEAIVHDGNGNMSSNGTNNYVHDAVNRLVTATIDTTTWTYAYGPLDRRMSKTDGTNIFQYLYDNDRAVAEYNGTGTLLKKYIYGPGLDEPIMMIVPGDPSETVYYYHADHLGSVIGLTNDVGAWVEKYAYTLYGKPAVQSTVGNPYMFTGRRLDTETGLYYYRARYYDPNLRRFIETDPIGYVAGINLYAYVFNNPLNYIDPYGQSRRRGTRYFNQNGPRDPYAELNYYGTLREIRRIDPSYSVLRNENRNIDWNDVNWLRGRLWEIRNRDSIRCPNRSNARRSGGFGNIGSHGPMSEEEALRNGINWLGPGYREVGRRGSGVFRSANNQRQFRITEADISGGHGPLGPHVHFEVLNSEGMIIENLHIPLIP
jgi:RHS repeat-associated protein